MDERIRDNEDKIRLCLVGACGRMGTEVVRAARKWDWVQITHAVDLMHVDENLRDVLGPEAPSLTITDKLGAALDASPADVVLDFTRPGAAVDHALSAIKRRVPVVIGTSGTSQEDLREIAAACEAHQTPAIVVPNFAIGAVLMMRFAELAARWLSHVEIIEMHHDEKLDAPSSTARRTAELISHARTSKPSRLQEKVTVEGVRGGLVGDIPVHSIRLRGLVAHQIVLFGGSGETLMIRHDTLDRVSFMEGVALALRRVRSLKGLVVGLEPLLFSDQAV